MRIVPTLVADDVHINADSNMLQGKRAFPDRLQRLKAPFPDLTIHDEYVLTDGDRAAVEYIMEGTQTGPLHLAGWFDVASEREKGPGARDRFHGFRQRGSVKRSHRCSQRERLQDTAYAIASK